MNSELLNKIGLGNIDPAYFIIGLLVLIVCLFIYILVLQHKLNKTIENYRKFMTGKDGKSLEQTIARKFAQMDTLQFNNKQITDKVENVADVLGRTFQKIGIVKYDAFNEMGGKLSFALALLDQENNGFVLNAMHSREGCYIYIKDVIKGESFVMLGEEEKEAVTKAVNYDNFME